jgi:hypothetical protein
MSNKLRQLRQDGKLSLWLDFRGNSLLDKSGNGNDAVASGVGANWANTRLGRSYKTHGTGLLTVADNAAIQLTKGYILAFGEFSKLTNFLRLASKRDAGGTNYDFYIKSDGLGFYDGLTTSGLNLSLNYNNMVGVKMSAGGVLTGFVDAVNKGAFSASVSVTADDADLIIANNYTGGSPLDGPMTELVLINDDTVSEEDIATIYNEYMQERGVLEQPRRGYVFNTQRLTDAVLDFDTTKTGDGKLADLSNSGNNGTITNFPVGQIGGVEYLHGNGVDSEVDFGTPWSSSVTAATLEGVFDGTQFYFGNTAATVRFAIRLISGTLYAYTEGGGGNYGTIAYTHSGLTHIALVYDGSGAGNTDRLKLYIDGEARTLSFTGTIPATLGDMSARTVFLNKDSGGTYGDGKYVFGKAIESALSAAQIKGRYYEWAKHLNFSHNLDDTPPTLANVTAGRIGESEFTRETGTWKVSEEAVGDKSKKWIENVTSGVAYTESSQAYGTWVFEINKGAVTQPAILFIADVIGNESATGQDGYNILLTSAESVRLRASSNGSGSNISYTAGSYIPESTDIKYAVTRRYDGQFSYYAKGGTLTEWTLADTSGGSGTNPSTNNATTVSQYICADLDAGDKFRMLGVHDGILTIGQLEELY